MAKIQGKIDIQEIGSNDVDALEREIMQGIFEDIMREVAQTYARKACYLLKDINRAGDDHIDEFKLTMEKFIYMGCELWIGNFESGNRYYKVFGAPIGD